MDRSSKKKGKRRSVRRMIRGGLHRLATHRRGNGAALVDGTPTDENKPESVEGPLSPQAAQLPSNLKDGGEFQPSLRVGPIMSTILLLGLAWLLIVAWWVSAMPEK
ncbi:MAG: hypothetical protein KF868_07440 [Acidobacteria bacterium]|nr:hypothetical protein [Acidobacteriota bacterium]MCW5967260.1 hypothetical protein [Blastocatellales bacterium]